MALCACGCGQDAGTYSRTVSSRGYVRGAPRQFVPGHAVVKAAGARWAEGAISHGNPSLTAQLRHLRETEGIAAVAAWCSARLEQELARLEQELADIEQERADLLAELTR